MMYLWVIRCFSVSLVVGGAGGVATFILTADQWANQNNVDIFHNIIVSVLYLLAVSTGLALWKKRNYGKIGAAILFSFQTPIFSSTFLSYEWFTGISIKLVNLKGRFDLTIDLGGADNFHLVSEFVGMVYGINLFAACAAGYLLFNYSKSCSENKKLVR